MSMHQVIGNLAEKVFMPQGVLGEPVLWVPFPLGEPVCHNEKMPSIREMTCYIPTQNIFHPWKLLKPNVSLAASRVTSAAQNL